MKETNRILKGGNKIILPSFLILTSVTLLISYISGMAGYTFEDKRLSAFTIIFSAAVYIFHIVLCIFMRFRKTSRLAKIIFSYQLAGSAAYILYFICFIFRISFAPFLYNLFHAWSFIFEPASVALGRLMGIRAKYIAAIGYLALTFITGKTVIAIRKDISYEKKYREDHIR